MALPDYFFNLKDFSHPELFLGNRPIWETLKILKTYLLNMKCGEILSPIPYAATIINPEKVSIGKGCVVESGAYIEGPCVIGEECHIRHGAYIRPYVLTGDRCVLGHASEFKHAILLDDVCAAHFNYVGDSILGNRVQLGAGVICANFRLDSKEVGVKIGGEYFKMGTKKFGAVIGDHSRLGCNSVINPGILLRKRTTLRACSLVQCSNITLR